MLEGVYVFMFQDIFIVEDLKTKRIILLKLGMCPDKFCTNVNHSIFLKAYTQSIFHHIKATTVEKLQHWIPIAGSQLEVGLV